MVETVDSITAEWVCEQYLIWAQERVEEGKLARSGFANKARQLGIFVEALRARIVQTITPDDATESAIPREASP